MRTRQFPSHQGRPPILPPTPLLPGKPTRYAQSPERPYSPSITISGDNVRHVIGLKNAFMRQRIHSPRRQRRAKCCQFNSIEERGALTGVRQVSMSHHNRDIRGAAARQWPGYGSWLFVRTVDFVRERYLLTSQLLLICKIRCQRCSTFSALIRLVVAMAPAFTSGESGLPPCNSKAITELKGNPVGSAPILSCTACGPTSSNARANVQTFEMDRAQSGNHCHPHYRPCYRRSR